MPVVFGVEVGDLEEVDLDWDTELIDTNTGRQVFNLGHQYVPPDQLFPSSKDIPFLLSCQICATVIRLEELIQVKRDFYPAVDVDEVFGDMQNQYRSEIVSMCYACVQRMMATSDAFCSSLVSEVPDASDHINNNTSQGSYLPALYVKEEQEDGKEMCNNVTEMTLEYTGTTVKKDQNSNDFESGDSGEEDMDTDDTSGGDVEKKDDIEEDDSGVELSIEDKAVYTCKVCDSEFESMDEFGRHTRTHERINARKCPTCNVHLSNDKFYDHLAMHGREIKQSIQELKIINREDKIKKLKLQKCSVCSWAFQSRSKLKKHRRKMHVKCIFCGVFFMDEKQCKKHMQEECDEFKKSQEQSSNASTQKTFPCTTCQTVHRSQEDLARHLKMHITYKKCRICSSKVRSGEMFKSHMNQHRTEQIEDSMDSSEAPVQQYLNKENASLCTSDKSTSQEHSLQEEDFRTTTAPTTWRQLSLQMKSKSSSVQNNNNTDINRSTISSSNTADRNIAKVTNTPPFISTANCSVDCNTVMNDHTSKKQTESNRMTSDEMNNSNEKVGSKRKISSSEKENKTRLCESEGEIKLTKKLSLKHSAKKIYFKKSPDILTLLTNKSSCSP